MLVVLGGLVGIVIVLFLICWLIGRFMIYLTERPDKKSRTKNKQQVEQKNSENKNNKQAFEEKVTQLQLQYEESEFVKLLVRLIEGDKPYNRDLVYIFEHDAIRAAGYSGKWRSFKTYGYESLPVGDRAHWLACAKALVKKLGPDFKLYLKDWNPDEGRKWATDYCGPQILIRYVGAQPLKKPLG